MTGTPDRKRNVQYVVPEPKALRTYARSVCDDLAQVTDASLADRDVVNGLAEFMRIAGRIQARYLNQSGAVDSPQTPGYGE